MYTTWENNSHFYLAWKAVGYCKSTSKDYWWM